MILAAGLGTRLLPYTQTTPKPLFPIAGRPLLDFIIHSLQKAGCEAIIVNTHHLPRKIEEFIGRQNYTIPILTQHEPEILDTGGAIRNVEDFWDDRPFMIINSDIRTDIDLKAVYTFHLNHEYPVTLVLYDYPDINTVCVNRCGFITGFNTGDSEKPPIRRTFTGIQVLNPEILPLIPKGQSTSSISLYKNLLLQDKKIKAFIPKNSKWSDIGTPERFRDTVFDHLAPKAFKKAYPNISQGNIHRQKLQGDGSDRMWYRLILNKRSILLADHGIRQSPTTMEADSFVAIGRHLLSKGIPLPKIYLSDTFSGQVYVEDLGNRHLQSVIQTDTSQKNILFWYRKIIDTLINMSRLGAEGFDPSWTYQTSEYSQELIIDRECRYFLEAFLKGYLNLNVHFDDFENEFKALAQRALIYGVRGFMHRDFQSRNIMIKRNAVYFIDFQGGRMGPVQYDLASLLIDPYVILPDHLQDQLVRYCAQKIHSEKRIPLDQFIHGYRYCAVARNLQILGAFGYLTKAKGKSYFSDYIPPAIKTLHASLKVLDKKEFPKLTEIVAQAMNRLTDLP